MVKFYEAAGKDAGLRDAVQAAEKQFLEAVQASARKAGCEITSQEFMEFLKKPAEANAARSVVTYVADNWCAKDHSCFAIYH
jgi:hypothetical protein